MENALVVNVVIALIFVTLPVAVASFALRRFRISRSENRLFYLGVVVFGVLAAIAVALPLVFGVWPGPFAVGLSFSTLPVWAAVREYCNSSRFLI